MVVKSAVGLGGGCGATLEFPPVAGHFHKERV